MSSVPTYERFVANSPCENVVFPGTNPLIYVLQFTTWVFIYSDVNGIATLKDNRIKSNPFDRAELINGEVAPVNQSPLNEIKLEVNVNHGEYGTYEGLPELQQIFERLKLLSKLDPSTDARVELVSIKLKSQIHSIIMKSKSPNFLVDRIVLEFEKLQLQILDYHTSGTYKEQNEVTGRYLETNGQIKIFKMYISQMQAGENETDYVILFHSELPKNIELPKTS